MSKLVKKTIFSTFFQVLNKDTTAKTKQILVGASNVEDGVRLRSGPKKQGIVMGTKSDHLSHVAFSFVVSNNTYMGQPKSTTCQHFH